MRPWVLMTAVLVSAAICGADNKKVANYPLRIHIFMRTATTFYQNRVAEEFKGEGRANLFENGQPRGVDFVFDCLARLQTSSGFETYPAKWKKANEELEVLIPEFGKSDKYDTCKLKVQMKDFAYTRHNGILGTTPVDRFKDWMVKHEYDPEHGKNMPTPNPPGSQSANGTQPTGSQ